MENLELLPTLVASGGIYLVYKIVMMIKKTLIKVSTIALAITGVTQGQDLNNLTLTSIPTMLTDNVVVNNVTDGILAGTDIVQTMFTQQSPQQ